MKKTITFLCIVIAVMSPTVIMSSQKEPFKALKTPNAQTASSVNPCIYAGGSCYTNGKIYHGIKMLP